MSLLPASGLPVHGGTLVIHDRLEGAAIEGESQQVPAPKEMVGAIAQSRETR